MAIDFKENVRLNINNLLLWRERYSKFEYPAKVVSNLFYDLLPLPELWNEFIISFGINKFTDIDSSFDFLHKRYREIQLYIQPYLVNILKNGVAIGGLTSNHYNLLIDKSKSKSNDAVEEIEFSYLVRDAMKAAFLHWFALGLTGLDKTNARSSIFNIIYPVEDWSSFDSVFQCFGQIVNAEISGVKDSDGSIITSQLYNSLPNLW